MHIGWNTHQFVTASIAPVTLRLFHAMQHILSAERLRRDTPLWDPFGTVGILVMAIASMDHFPL